MDGLENRQEAIAELTSAGDALRAGFNMRNPLLVTGKTEEGYPIGVARDMAESIAKTLGVPLQCVPYPRPDLAADAVNDNAWDICFVGAEPKRMEKINFTNAYVEIKATYLAPADSPFRAASEVDRPGTRIIVRSGAAYELWLNSNIQHAEITRVATFEEALQRFLSEKFDVLAALEEQLLVDVKQVPGGRILDGKFTSVQQAIGTQKKNLAAAKFLRAFVEEAKKSGFVADSIKRHQAKGLSVAPVEPA